MKQKQKTYRTHTVRTRQLARLIGNLQKKQLYHRKIWLDADVMIGALKYKINDLLRRQK
jgi:hypothetical protein